MQRTHSWIPALLAAVTFGGAGVMACSDDRLATVVEGDDDAGATPTSDATGTPPTPPARKPPFDPADENVTCAQEPCAVELVAGDAHFCARMQSGTVRCWGANAFGVLGRAPSDQTLSVATVEGLTGVEQLSSGGTTTCALVSGGAVQCWGNNSDGLLGLQVDAVASDGAPHPTPAPVALSGPAVRVDIGPRVGCAILATGQTR